MLLFRLKRYTKSIQHGITVLSNQPIGVKIHKEWNKSVTIRMGNITISMYGGIIYTINIQLSYYNDIHIRISKDKKVDSIEFRNSNIIKLVCRVDDTYQLREIVLTVPKMDINDYTYDRYSYSYKNTDNYTMFSYFYDQFGINKILIKNNNVSKNTIHIPPTQLFYPKLNLYYKNNRLSAIEIDRDIDIDRDSKYYICAY